ncbi:hypothetical protein NDU88_006425 [Pleurodeles waltl]|uniref:Uncharacterized protein n=1 Tax=Pleurodeles waltl TaxID=8319 RepID=A0AAV7WXK3_PLEWA|nr:hypothetical protein NDU88_006425 [Pleurodeles waltl]
MEVGEHGGLRHLRSALGRFRFLGGTAGRDCRSDHGSDRGRRHTDVRTAFFLNRGRLEGSGGCLVAPGRAGAAPGMERCSTYSPSGE